jgi:hypothetical protein
LKGQGHTAGISFTQFLLLLLLLLLLLPSAHKYVRRTCSFSRSRSYYACAFFLQKADEIPVSTFLSQERQLGQILRHAVSLQPFQQHGEDERPPRCGLDRVLAEDVQQARDQKSLGES